jgi:hypothetical protein
LSIFRHISNVALTVALVGLGSGVLAQGMPKAPAARQGWHWYVDPKPAEPVKPRVEPEIIPAPVVPSKVVIVSVGKPTDEPAKNPCLEKDSWMSTCGFIDPGDNFEFQSLQRDILLQQMSLRPDVPEVVEAAQRYMKWVVGKASQAANMWYFNLVQKPDLDPTVKSPISELGLALASKVTQASQSEYFKMIRAEGGILFYFSRNDCIYCHDQVPYVQRVARTMGLELINVPLDGKCIEGFSGEACADNIPEKQIAVLNVQTVPATFLYVPSNTWLRLSTGVTTDSTILANTVNFFSAYRAAMLQGIDNSDGVRPSVSFNPEYTGPATGVARADGKPVGSMPSQSRMMDLLGYGAPK